MIFFVPLKCECSSICALVEVKQTIATDDDDDDGGKESRRVEAKVSARPERMRTHQRRACCTIVRA